MKVILLLFLIAFVSGCTKKEPETPAIEVPQISVSEIAPTATPTPDPLEIKCNERWAKARAAFEKFEETKSIANFKLLVDAIPKPPEDKPEEQAKLCENSNVVTEPIDGKMNELFEQAGGVFNFTVFLARVQHAADGAIGEGICAEGPSLLQKDAPGFVRALQQERSVARDVDCMVRDSTEFLDMTDAQIRKGLEKRIELLKKVKDPKLTDYRDDLIGRIRTELKTL